MIPARNQEYLKAMGIDVWISRSRGGAAGDPDFNPVPVTKTAPPLAAQACVSEVVDKIVIGPGASSTLFLVGKSEEAGTALAADIARSMDSEPVWSWPAHNSSVPGISLEQAIRERLIARILVFGPSLLIPAVGASADVIGSAQLIRADSIPVLLESGAARRALWSELSARQWCAERARKT